MLNIRRLYAGGLGLLIANLAFAQPSNPDDLYENFGFVDVTTELPINARAFANYGVFNVTSELPFDFQNTLNFTNTGTMGSSVGFRFDHVSDLGVRSPADNFVNQLGGEIVGLGQSDATFVLINATNIVNEGLLEVGPNSLLEIKGENVNLFNAGLLVDPITGQGSIAPFTTNDFLPDVGINGIYWGGITNTIMDASAILAPAGPSFVVRSPTHQVTNGSFGFSTSLNLQNPDAFVYSNAVTETNIVIQAVFVSVSDQKISRSVRFEPSTITNEVNTAILRLQVPLTNVVSGQSDLFELYLEDTLAWDTNLLLYTNFSGADLRPSTYNLGRVPPASWFGGGPPNSEVSATLLYDSVYTNSMVTNLYAAYSASVENLTSTTPPLPGVEVTDLPGRIEISAKNLNLENTRFRGEGVISVQADHLIGTSGAFLDSQNLSFDLASTNGVLEVENLAADQIDRFHGEIRAWSGIWTNLSGVTVTNEDPDPNDPTMTVTNVVTNVITIYQHVMIVDATDLQTTIDVTTHDFSANGENVTVKDDMFVINSFLSDAESFTLDGSIQIFTRSSNIGSTNFPNVLNFTNNGSLTVQEVASFGADRFDDDGDPQPYESFINNGVLNAFSPVVRTDYFENAGNITAGGRLLVNADQAKLVGGSMVAGFDLTLEGGQLKLQDYSLTSALGLNFDVAGTLNDSGPTANNSFIVGSGFNLRQRPSGGDLLGTTIRSSMPRFASVGHTWAAENRGKGDSDGDGVPDGFVNNTAVGHLILSAPPGSKARFFSTIEGSAMYVEMLELTSNLENSWETDLVVQPGFTLYFAGSNVLETDLDGASDGRVVWVPGYAGALSGLDVALEDGTSIRANRGLRESLIIDSDGDGTANGIDPFPFDGPVLTEVNVDNTDPMTASISFVAAARTTYRVEYSSELATSSWSLLKTVTNTAGTKQKITVVDPMAEETHSRFYRVTYRP